MEVMVNLGMLTDDELVARYLQNDDAAFDELLNRYKEKLYTYILYMVKNPDIADDVFQETFVKAIVTLRDGRYTATGRFYPWLTRIAHNLVGDQFRSERTRPMVYSDDEEADVFNTLSLAELPLEDDLCAEQTLSDLVRLVELLPETQREVVKMRFYQGMSFKEIADVTGVSINTALGRMRYAVLNLRKGLGA